MYKVLTPDTAIRKGSAWATAKLTFNYVPFLDLEFYFFLNESEKKPENYKVLNMT